MLEGIERRKGNSRALKNESETLPHVVACLSQSVHEELCGSQDHRLPALPTQISLEFSFHRMDSE